MQLNAPAVFYNERTEEYHTVYNYQIIEEPYTCWQADYRNYTDDIIVMKPGRWFANEENVICGPLVEEDGVHKVIINADEWILVSIGKDIFFYTPPEPDIDYIEEWRKLMQE